VRKTPIRGFVVRFGGYKDAVVLLPPDDQRQVRVLLVDDEPIFRDVGRSLVEATAGFVVAGEADSGEAALEAVAELRPDLVIMDRRMGGLDGISATRLITERHPGVAVVVVSVGPLEEGALDGCGALAFVRKQDLSPKLLRACWAQRGRAAA
jgi:two-component system, NarL family, invasion response regulator UvrY